MSFWFKWTYFTNCSKFVHRKCTRMSGNYIGKLKIKESELNLDLTLLGGQSFRWEKVQQPNEETVWKGVAFGAFWMLTQNSEEVMFEVFPADADPKVSAAAVAMHYEKVLGQYLRVDFELPTHLDKWRKAHKHFDEIGTNMKAVRVLDQEPLENILSFICSQNNHIKRISAMINWLCARYGSKIAAYKERDVYAFPTLDELIKHQKQLETELRDARFGYRAKFIKQAVDKISANGGQTWLSKLRDLSYEEARLELVKLPGIGFKVADCICLMSLNHLEAVPVDTHIFKIAQVAYMPQLSKTKAVTPKIYDEIANHFREVYGEYAGWAQTVLFCSVLQQFQEKSEAPNAKKAKKRKEKS